MKLIAAMSGGVDSAVAAARAVESGNEVIVFISRYLRIRRSIDLALEVVAPLRIHMTQGGLRIESEFRFISGICLTNFTKMS